MNIEAFEKWSMILGITALIGFMGFIMWDLAKQSKAGRFGTIMIFVVLGLGLLGFIIKTVVVSVLEQ
ncbi:DUF2788 domain-containing protein [Marinagarivorans cellulosilyticus]|uniref:DUF2788 domain-containing protein n=1 Tax=Marinagarivorans cellulosilyticus TaxID=2721545 RepID=A0AAN1WGT2_9GAMM|nr:DUF2788 domain-containing protein [Marinagarivorans cellulosilyticus]BCD97317.1 hypothetical protein MARGE09_P1518 [Marinagarivorans cellulosilyticus]